jgi:hypothetical protein
LAQAVQQLRLEAIQYLVLSHRPAVDVAAHTKARQVVMEDRAVAAAVD